MELLVRTIHGRIDKLLPWNVAEALGELHDPRVIGPLPQLLTTASPLMQGRAAVALGVMRERRAVEPLSTLVRDNRSDAALRNHAAIALGQIGDERAIAPLMEALRFDGLGGQAGHSLNALGEPSFAPLVDALRDPEPDTRLWAIDALRWRDDVRVVSPLATVLSTDPDDDVCKEAAEALAEQGEPGVHALLGALMHERAQVRYASARALREIASLQPEATKRTPSPAEVRVHLLPLLSDSDPRVRQTVAATLRLLGY